jgi:cytidylate kinase
MKKLPTIERYLSAQLAEKGSARTGPTPAIHPFVTISRQAGAGGHRLAETLLDLFAAQEDDRLFGGWQVFDRRLCEIVADNPAYSTSMSSLLEEEYRTKTNEFFSQLLDPTIDQDILMRHVFEVVRAVASIGKSIIVGRAGSEVTRGMGPGVAVRLIAPEEVRIAGVMEYYGLDERAARDKARRVDESRARLLKAHFRVDIDDPTRYDAVWNTGLAPIETIAESIAAGLRHKVAAAVAARPA